MKIRDRIQRRLLNLNTFSSIKEWAYWRKLRKAFIKKNSKCVICGYEKELNVHHKKPRHLFPELVLSWDNLITLCRDCHFHIGHRNNWREYEEFIEEIAEEINKIKLLRKIKEYKNNEKNKK